MISYRFVPISSQKGVLFLRHPVCRLTGLPWLKNENEMKMKMK